MRYQRVRGGIITVRELKGSAPARLIAFVVSGMQFWAANELSHGTSRIPTPASCTLNAIAQIIWNTSAHLGGWQMGTEAFECKTKGG